jgi:hypothetical protein
MGFLWDFKRKIGWKQIEISWNLFSIDFLKPSKENQLNFSWTLLNGNWNQWNVFLIGFFEVLKRKINWK